MAGVNLGPEGGQEFVTVLTTGQLKPMYKGAQTELNTIHQENSEMLESSKVLEGQIAKIQEQVQAGAIPPEMAEQLMTAAAQALVPPVLLDDNDDLHMGEHKSVYTSPKVRRNGAVTRIGLAHQQAHQQNKITKAVKAALDAAQVQLQTQQALGPAAMLLQPQAPQGQAPAQEQAPQQNQAQA